jgi:hypothetical protein
MKAWSNVFRHLAIGSFSVAVLALAFFLPINAFGFLPEAQAERAQPVRIKPPKSGFSTVSGFFKNVRVNGQLNRRIVNLDAKSTTNPKPEDEKEIEVKKNVPEDATKIKADKDAPLAIKNMVRGMNKGDREAARKGARDYVSYLRNYFFYVRDMTQLIGEQLINQDVIDEDKWFGVEQHMSIEMAKTRKELGALITPTHESAMERIKPDPKNQVEVYVFFTLNCSWCRYMSADLERLWQMVKDDPNVKMSAFTMGETSAEWLSEYRAFTGLSIPIQDGSQLAKAFNIAYVPAVVVVTPNNNDAYLKSGQQSFENLYEFVRRAQGLPATVTKRYLALENQVIGEMERAKLATLQPNKKAYSTHVNYRVTHKKSKDSLERF